MIIKDHITNDQLAQDILRDLLVKHNTGKCDCSEQKGQVYPCTASQWLRGILTSKQILENYYYEQSKK